MCLSRQEFLVLALRGRPQWDVEGERARAVGRESGRGSLWEFPASVNELSENEEHDGHLERGGGVK